MAHLSLTLMGEFQAMLAGQPVIGFHSDKVRALLAYLAVEASQPHTRKQLAGLLWPDWPESAARTYLRQALFDLRRLLGDREASTPFLLASHRTIQFNLQSDYSLDLVALNAATDSAARATSPLMPADLEPLQQVIARCAGNFMEGFFLDGCSAYEEWQLLKREQLRRQVVQLVRTLVGGYEQIGDQRQALQHARQHVELDPLSDTAHKQVIRLLQLTGDSGAALVHYRRYSRTLDEELGAAPAAEITALVERIRTGEAPAVVEPARGTIVSSDASDIPHIPLPPSILAAAPPTSRLPFVARESELAQLTMFLARAMNAQGGVVFVCGDAGQGKTTLVQEFARRAQESHPALVVATGACDAHTGMGDPYQPFREVIGLLTGDISTPWRAGTITRAQAASLWNAFPLSVAKLLTEGPDLIGVLVPGQALLARVVDSGLGDYVDTDRLHKFSVNEPPAPVLRQAALFEQAVSILRSLADEFPLLLILEDLHWADLGTTSLLFHLGRHLVGSPILIVGSYRPEEVALGRNGGQHPLTHVLHEFQQASGEITVDLRRSDGRGFVETLLETHPNRLGNAFRETLYRHSQGHALFTVELLRAMQERGDLIRDPDGHWIQGRGLNWDAMPARVEAAIAQRINRLPTHLRELLSVASVEGERFTAEIVARVAGLDEQEVIGWLSAELERRHQLVLAHGIRRVNGLRLSQYRFRHELFQKYIYSGLDDVERAYLHEKIGFALEQRYADREEELDALAPRLAWHFHQARIYDKAIVYFGQAGAIAVRMAANEEAITHLQAALSLLKQIADITSRAEQELALQALLAVALGRLHGQGNPVVVAVFRRVLTLSDQIDDGDSRFLALHGLWLYHWIHADLDGADRFAEQMLAQAETSQRDMLLAHANCALGHNRFTVGALTKGRERFERSVGHCELAEQVDTLQYLDDDVVAAAYPFLAYSLWLLGYPDQALAQIGKLFACAQSGMHPYDLAHAHVGAMALHQYRREAAEVCAAAEIVFDLSNKHGFVQWRSWAAFMHGWATAQLSRGSQGLDEMEDGAAAWSGLVWGARQRAIMADAYAVAGRTQQGLALLDEALEIVDQTGERLFEAEIHRLRGKLLLMSRNDGKRDVELAQIESCFRQAINVARGQQAKSWELRATMDLSRLLFEQGKRSEARIRLAAIDGWFCEGFDTPDLRSARKLLDSLAPDESDDTAPS